MGQREVFGADDEMPVLVAQMQAAKSRRELADVLLRCPDIIIAQHFLLIGDVLVRAAFEDGYLFLRLRHSCLCCVRDAAGLLPMEKAENLEVFRSILARFAAEPPEPAPFALPSPTDIAAELTAEAFEEEHETK